MKRYTWVLEIEVDETWVEDGFDLSDPEEAKERIMRLLPFAHSNEVDVRVLKTPPIKEVRKAQGYND